MDVETPDSGTPNPELLGAALAASFDEIHLLRQVGGGDAPGFERVGGPARVESQVWFEPAMFAEVLALGIAREDEIQTAEGALLRRIVPFRGGVGVCIRSAVAGDERVEPAEIENEQEAMRRVATAACGRVAPDLLFDLIARETGGLLGAAAARVTRFEGDESVVVGTWGEPPDIRRRLPLTGGRAVARVAATGRPARVHDYRSLAKLDGESHDIVPSDYRSGVAAPIFVGPRPWGAVVAFSTEQAGAFGVHEERRLSRLAELLAMAIANADERAHVAEQATNDSLTGLVNHRAFQERLATEVQRARRYGRQLSLSIFNLDHFKQFNLVNGHEAGDRVLAEVGRRMTAVSRAGELVARIGGEEFGWILPETDAMSAYAATERLRGAISAAATTQNARVTVSAGLCDLSQARDASELVDLAKGALYWAKVHGRDCSFVYTPEVVEVLSANDRAERLARSQTLAGIRAMARAIDAKDPSTHEHSERVADLAGRLADVLDWSGERMALLRESGLVHDVGKIGVPDAILFKDGALTDAEYERVKLHAPRGAEIASEVLTAEQVSWVRGHHERPDGRGYPDGLLDHEIPDGARILALADAVDVMTGARHYKKPMGWEDALTECRAHAGAQFAVEVVEALEELWATGPPPDSPHAAFVGTPERTAT